MSEIQTGISPTRLRSDKASAPDEASIGDNPCVAMTRVSTWRTWASSSTMRHRVVPPSGIVAVTCETNQERRQSSTPCRLRLVVITLLQSSPRRIHDPSTTTGPRARLRYPLGTCGAHHRAPGWCGHAPHLPDLDLRPRGAREAPGLRVCSYPEPHPRGAGAECGQSGGGH